MKTFNINHADIKQFPAQIILWHKSHGRHDLPWQAAPTAYQVWISEIMLQQTQVSTVIPYYQKFLSRFPDIAALALSQEDEVLAHWSGLGYYARARNLYRTAQILWHEHQGEFPKTVLELSALPGIGRSTAGAILSFSMQMPTTILDGNIKRVLCRYHAVRGWPGNPAVNKQLWQLAEKYTPLQKTHLYNQGLMDLGATICTSYTPKCSICPLQAGCQALRQNCIQAFPERKPVRPRRRRTINFLIFRSLNSHAILLERRPPLGIWGGLWSLPEYSAAEEDLAQWCLEHFNCRVLRKEKWAIVEHSLTHVDLEIQPFFLLVTPEISRKVLECSPRIWYKESQDFPGGIASPIATLIKKALN